MKLRRALRRPTSFKLQRVSLAVRSRSGEIFYHHQIRLLSLQPVSNARDLYYQGEYKLKKHRCTAETLAAARIKIQKNSG